MTEITVCSLCGSDHGAVEEMGIFHDITFGIPGEFPLVRCRNCGLIYYRERPTSEEIGLYYPDGYIPYRRPIQDEGFFLMRWARWRNISKRCQVVKQYSPRSPGNILDVGCSTGIFLNAMKTEGWETQGIEINSNAAQFARQRFGLEIFHGQLLNTQISPKSVDVITFWDVIEHTFDPLATLKKAHLLLKDGGIVVMTLPHWESLDRRLFGLQWIGYDTPRHLHIFPQEVLEKLLEKADFDILRTWCGIGGYFTFIASLWLWLNVHVKSSRLRKVIIKLLNLPGIRFVFQPLFSISDKLGVGGTLVVIARKSEE